MYKKRILLLSILSLAITSFSPLLFSVYFEQKPIEIKQTAIFGAPFPFAEQSIQLPTNAKQYPVEIEFVSPLAHETHFKVLPFMLSLFSFFLITFSLTTILLRAFKGSKNIRDDRP